MTPYTAYRDIQGIIYQDDMDKNRLMRTDELHKFSDGTLNHVRTSLNNIATGIQMEYLSKRKWTKQDKQRSRVMIKAIDKKLKYKRLMRSQEKFVGQIWSIPHGFEGYSKQTRANDKAIFVPRLYCNVSAGNRKDGGEESFNVSVLTNSNEFGKKTAGSNNIIRLQTLYHADMLGGVDYVGNQEANGDSINTSVVKIGGSVLGLLEDMIRVGQAMGYKMDGCAKDLEGIIGNLGVDVVHK
ncbi:hypothetical protein Tco_1230115 [Tanacetum coccineum]